ncbi:C-type lectin domain family 4 member C-like [Panulirus ornatus]|uniref:C-type lectin domain family 4 member C-like n=1 Tax=Panulirus ornatus TaxID=150431 RepID=UPI003A86E7D8
MKRFCALLVVLGVATPLVLARCPDSFHGLSGSCFHFVTSGRWNWATAREECKKLGADLAVLNSPEKLTYVSDFMNRHLGEGGSTFFWVGGHNLKGFWTWVNGDRMNVNSNVWVPETPSKTTEPSYALLSPPRTQGRRYMADINSRIPGFICEI